MTLMLMAIKVEVLRDGRLVVWSIEDSRELYSTGYYGKPLGISKPDRDFESPLILDPVEGVYLLEKGIIEVYRHPDKQRVTIDVLTRSARRALQNFDIKYAVYKDLRERGLVVTPGIKYGSDFAVYIHGPGIDHAPFIIQIMRAEERLAASEIVKSGRLATTVRKTFIIALVDAEDVSYLEFKWWRA